MSLSNRLKQLEARQAEAPQQVILYLPEDGTESYDVREAWEEFLRNGPSGSAVVVYPSDVDIHQFQFPQK